jgi:hypothetical protein
MPLKAGGKPGGKNFVSNIRELMAAHARKGHIGNSPNESREKANKRAVAIAYTKARKG